MRKALFGDIKTEEIIDFEPMGRANEAMDPNKLTGP
jgi:hypothetical protein